MTQPTVTVVARYVLPVPNVALHPALSLVPKQQGRPIVQEYPLIATMIPPIADSVTSHVVLGKYAKMVSALLVQVRHIAMEQQEIHPMIQPIADNAEKCVALDKYAVMVSALLVQVLHIAMGQQEIHPMIQPIADNAVLLV